MDGVLRLTILCKNMWTILRYILRYPIITQCCCDVDVCIIYVCVQVDFYISQSQAANHAVRERHAACICTAELGTKVGGWSCDNGACVTYWSFTYISPKLRHGYFFSSIAHTAQQYPPLQICTHTHTHTQVNKDCLRLYMVSVGEIFRTILARKHLT